MMGLRRSAVRGTRSLRAGFTATRKTFATATVAAAAIAAAAATASATATAAAPPSAGITEHGEVTLEALVGRSLAHLKETTGTVKVRGLDVRWWRYENPARCDKAPVVALHGGPSMTHHSVKPLVLLADEGHPVIFYDQAGCGESSRDAAENPSRDTPWLLTVGYYVEELYAVLTALGLLGGSGTTGRSEGYYVYGLSWGSMLAQEFAVTQPSGLRGLILSGALCDGEVYIKTQWRDRISTMPTFTQKLLRELEDTKGYDSKAYANLDAVLGMHFTSRLTPKLEGARSKRGNPAIYAGMQGESEFTFGGVLKGWTIADRNASILVPTLVLAGEFDTMSIECHQQVVDSIPTAWPLMMIPRAAHCKLLDEPQLVVGAVAKFLHTCEKTRELAAF